jgi:dTDP-4-amino-4,6-dideoxygalactose transaminase
VILRQLDRLEWNLTRRRKLAQLYQTELSSHPEMSLPVLPLDCKPAWIQFPIRVNDKLAFYKHMQRHSTDVTWTYRYSCAESYGQGGCPNALQAAKTVVGLPTTPFISNEQVIDICRAANQFTG